MAAWVEETFGVVYAVSGMTDLPQCLSFVLKKPKRVPGTAEHETQEAFVAEYETSEQSAARTASHRQRNPMLS